MNDKVNILVTLDENYMAPLKVMLTSLYLNNLKLDFKVWLIHEKIPQEQLGSLEKLLLTYGIELSDIKVPDDLFSDAPTVERYPKEMYYRMICGMLLPDDVEKVLYLDPDILIINSIKELWNLDLEDNLFAAAMHTGITNMSNDVNNIRLGTTHGYFNSGVMLIDVKKAREIVKLEDIYDTIKNYGDYLLLPDQDIMNYLYGSMTKEIPEEIWNYDTRFANRYFAKSRGIVNRQWVAKNTSILHFCGRPKPWDRKSSNRFTLLYLHYQELFRRNEENSN